MTNELTRTDRSAEDNEVIRITTTADKAKALYDAVVHPLAARQADTTFVPIVREALAEVREALGQPERKRRYAQTLLDMGFPEPQEPTRVEGGMHDDYREDHPAYALIGANRMQSTGTALAGTDFEHRQFVTITIKRASAYRGHASDRWHADNEVVEVKLSEAQWATFVSSFGIGDGVPCSLEFTETDGHLPGIIPITDRREQVNDEVKRDLAEAVAALDEALSRIEDRNERVSKESRDLIRRARQRLTESVPFVIKRADEHMEDTIEHAKIEFSAYANAAIRSAGLTALGAEPPIKMIESGDES